MAYKLYAVVIHPRSHKVTRQEVLAVEYDHAEALAAVAQLEKGRDQSAKFGTFHNPLRYEAWSPTLGTAAECDWSWDRPAEGTIFDRCY